MRKFDCPLTAFSDVARAIADDPMLLAPLLIVLALCVVLGVVAWFRFG